MSTPITILTGASRGMGAAIALQLLGAGHRVLAMARGHNPALDGPRCEQWRVDLQDAAPVADRLAAWLGRQAPAACGRIALINNAALLGEPGPLAAAEGDQVASVLRVGLEAPMLLTAAFLRATAHWPCPRQVLNISSGLGRRAMAGSAAYCAAKAGLDHFSRAVALEQGAEANGAKIVALAPGVIETDMQATLRGADARQFPDRERFIELQAQGLLSSPEVAAKQVVHFLHRPDFGTAVVADIRDV